MTLPTFSIGSFEFTRFTSPRPPLPKPHFVQETKPGRDGFAAVAVGKWGEPFVIEAESVFPLFVDATDAITAYENAPSLTPVNVVWASFDMSTVDVNFLIEAVEVVDVRTATAFQRGNVIYSPAHVVMSRWTLRSRAT